MWPSTPLSIPPEWRSSGANALADAIGYGTKLCPTARAAEPVRDAYVWYDQKTDVKKKLSFQVAHGHACDLAALIRAGGVASGRLDTLTSHQPFVVGLSLRRTASLPLSQLAAFKAGATFVPCDPAWPVERTVAILTEAKASIVLADAADSEALTVSPVVSSRCPRPAEILSHLACSLRRRSCSMPLAHARPSCYLMSAARSWTFFSASSIARAQASRSSRHATWPRRCANGAHTHLCDARPVGSPANMNGSHRT